MLIRSIYNLLENPVPLLQTTASCCYVFKGHSIFLSCKLLQDGWEHGKVEDSLIVGPLSHLFGCEVSSLNRSDTVWNTILIDKAFYKPQMVGLAEALCAGKGCLRLSLMYPRLASSSLSSTHGLTLSSPAFFQLPSAGSTWCLGMHLHWWERLLCKYANFLKHRAFSLYASC